LQEKLAELYLAEKKYDDALNCLELAFKNKCSLNQRIRIALNYTDTLISLGRQEKALAFLKQTEKTYPQLFENQLLKDKFQTISQKAGNK